MGLRGCQACLHPSDFCEDRPGAPVPVPGCTALHARARLEPQPWSPAGATLPRLGRWPPAPHPVGRGRCGDGPEAQEPPAGRGPRGASLSSADLRVRCRFRPGLLSGSTVPIRPDPVPRLGCPLPRESAQGGARAGWGSAAPARVQDLPAPGAAPPPRRPPARALLLRPPAARQVPALNRVLKSCLALGRLLNLSVLQFCGFCSFFICKMRIIPVVLMIN